MEQSNTTRAPEVQNNEKVLRLGILSEKTQNLEEKLIPRRTAVTLGKTPESTLAFPYIDLPHPLTLFQPQPDGRYALCFSEEMTGKIKTKNKEHSLQECIEKKLASKQGAFYFVTLPPSAQGRVQFKDITILFSFVPAKKKAAPLISAELQQPFFSSLDKPFLAMLLLSLGLHAGVAFMAQTRIVPQQEPLFLEETLASLIQQPATSAPPVQEPKNEPIVSDAKEEKIENKAPPSPALTNKPRVTAAPSDESTEGRVGVAYVLGRDSINGGPFADLFNNDDPSKFLDGIKPTAVQQGKEGDDLGTPLQTGPKEDSGKLFGLNNKDTQPNVPTSVPVSTKKEKPIKTKIEPIVCDDCTGPGPTTEPGNPLGPYKQRIQLCYERELTNNEALAGKLSVMISISEAGRVIGVDTTTDTIGSENIGVCVKNIIKGVKFPPQDQEVKASVSFIFSKQ
jgi:hypothetical protein